MATLEQAAGWVAQASRIVVFTGAGVSTAAGIPDFRGPAGVWTRNPSAERQSTLQNYLADGEMRRSLWRQRLHSPMWDAQPTASHRAIHQLDQRGQLLSVVTQNVDGLHQKAGHDASKVIEVHGSARWTLCWGCGERLPMLEVLQRVSAGEDDPACELCGGVLKSSTILFGENLQPQVIEAAFRVARECDLLIAAGTMLSVYPAARIVPTAKEHGAKVIIANGGATDMDHHADALLRGDLSETLPALCESRPNG